MTKPKFYEAAGFLAGAFRTDSGSTAWVRRAPFLMNAGPIKGWLSQRDLPPTPPKSFRQLWRERNSAK
jgi:hypothetical protein